MILAQVVLGLGATMCPAVYANTSYYLKYLKYKLFKFSIVINYH